MDRVYRVFNKINLIIFINLSFLVMNLLFFEVFFAIDFKVIYFPLYYVSSLLILPSSIAIIRTTSSIEKKNVPRFFRTIWQELTFTFKFEWKYWLILHTSFFLTILNLYVAKSESIVTLIFYAANVVLFILELFLGINLIGISMEYKKLDLVKKTFLNLKVNSWKIMRSLILGFLFISLISKVSFTFIIISFGMVFYWIYLEFSNFQIIKKLLKVTSKTN